MRRLTAGPRTSTRPGKRAVQDAKQGWSHQEQRRLLVSLRVRLQADGARGTDASSRLAGSQESTADILAQVETALQRMDDGLYGYCEECGLKIPEARLLAVPHAAHCLQCASRSRPSGAARASDERGR